MLKYSLLASAAASVLALMTVAHAAPLPAPVGDMVREAVASGDAAQIKAVVDIAKKTNPNSVAEIDELVAGQKASVETARVEKAKAAGYFEGWKGEGSVAFSSTNGNSKASAVAVGVVLSKDGVSTRHTVRALADYARSNGVSTAEKYLADYKLDWKITDRFYAYGLVGWDRDRFGNIQNRWTESVGLGYRLIDTDMQTFDIEGGPTYRQTTYYVGGSDKQFQGRVAAFYNLKINDNFAFSQSASYLFGGDNETVLSTTALTGTIMGDLQARFSYDVKYESNPLPGKLKTDTATRFGLVYGF